MQRLYAHNRYTGGAAEQLLPQRHGLRLLQRRRLACRAAWAQPVALQAFPMSVTDNAAGTLQHSCDRDRMLQHEQASSDFPAARCQPYGIRRSVPYLWNFVLWQAWPQACGMEATEARVALEHERSIRLCHLVTLLRQEHQH